MTIMGHMMRTERLVMRGWRETDREPFAVLNADPQVMEHFPEKLSREQSDAFADRIEAGFAERGWGLWALEADGVFIGYTGLQPVSFETHFTPAVEIGWRLARGAWGRGYASEAAAAVLRFGFEGGLPEIIAVSHTNNEPSKAVMRRIGMTDHGVTDKWYDDPSALFVMTAEQWAETQPKSD